jgi:hypothetical protein
MAQDPQLIAAFGRHVAAELARAGGGRVAVYAQAQVALNARPSRTFLDPRIDLTREAPRVLPAP